MKCLIQDPDGRTTEFDSRQLMRNVDGDTGSLEAWVGPLTRRDASGALLCHQGGMLHMEPNLARMYQGLCTVEREADERAERTIEALDRMRQRLEETKC